MSRLFYARLAADNIRKNAKTYVPYLLTCIGCIMMYYILHAMCGNSGLQTMSGGGSIAYVLFLGSVILGAFSVIFLLYTNSFLIKRRKKELGLFNILGMEKKHIGWILFFESVYTAAITLTAGLLGGILFSRLMSMLLLRIMDISLDWDYSISLPSALASVKLFGVIYLLTLANNLRQIKLSSPIELLRGGQVGEREPKTKFLMALLGMICLAAAYYMALTSPNPSSAISIFFAAVLLVIAGTYLLFTAGSILFLKLLRKNKRYYYKTRHFISVSGMIYRMKQNAAGLASICILSCAVLVMLSSTVALYIGIDDAMKTRYPRDIIITTKSFDPAALEAVDREVQTALSETSLSPEHSLSYRYIDFASVQNGSEFLVTRETLGDYGNMCFLYFLPLEDYNKLSGAQETLEENQVMIFSNRINYSTGLIKGGGLYSYPDLSIFQRNFSVVKTGYDDFLDGGDRPANVDGYVIVVSDISIVGEMAEGQAQVFDQFSSSPTYYTAFDVNGGREDCLRLAARLTERLNTLPSGSRLESRDMEREEFYTLYGGLFFLGIFLGLVFLMATVLIIYYKQISEGYDDKSRYEIMQKVGLSQKEIKGSIHSQILLMFFLPLGMAAVHIAFAFPLITQLLAVLNLTNVRLYAWCTLGSILIFGLFYGIVYGMTSKVYYRIVKR